MKFSDSPAVYLVDNGQLRHITKEVNDKSGRSIFQSMVILDPSYRQGVTMGSSISSNLPFDPKPKGWEKGLAKPTQQTSTSTPQPTATPQPSSSSSSSTTAQQKDVPIGKEGVNHLVSIYLGRDATQQELDRFSGITSKEDKVLRQYLDDLRQQDRDNQVKQQEQAQKQETSRRLSDQEITALFDEFGLSERARTPEQIQWVRDNLPNDEAALRDILKIEQKKKNEMLKAQGLPAQNTTGATGASTSYGLPAAPDVRTAHFRSEDGALVTFTTDPNGSAPGDETTVWLVDPKTKTLRPFLSEEAFNNYFDMSLADAGAQNKIARIATSELAGGGILNGYELLPDSQGVQGDGTVPNVDVNTGLLKDRYGQQSDETTDFQGFQIMDSWLDYLKNSNSGVSASTIDNVRNNERVIALYWNALTSGGYSLADVYRDLKRRELIAGGQTDLQGLKVIDESKRASEYYNTDEYQKAINNPSLSDVPAQIGDLDFSSIENLSIFNLDPKVFETIVPPIDYSDPSVRAEMENIKSAMHDVMLKQFEAQTQQQKALADDEWNRLRDEISRNYGIQLSANAYQAFLQLENLGNTFSERNLGNTGMEMEGVQKYLKSVRKNDQILREQRLSDEEKAQRDYYLKYASPEQIAALAAEDANLPEDQQRVVRWGLKPSADISNYFSKENLKAQYPNLSDQEIQDYIDSVVDENGNFRSNLYQTLASNRLNTLQSKQEYQQNIYQEKQLLNEEKAYREFTQNQNDPFRSATPSSAVNGPTDPYAQTTTPPSTTTAPSATNTNTVTPQQAQAASQAASQVSNALSNPPSSTTSTTKPSTSYNVPSGLLVRDASNGAIYFTDNGTKRHITSMDVLTPGAGYVNVGSDVLGSLKEGSAISAKPGFNFKSQQDVEKALKSAGIPY